jgi:hypothetical protein
MKRSILLLTSIALCIVDGNSAINNFDPTDGERKYTRAANGVESGQTPKGLAPSDWSSIRAAYQAGRHAIQRQDDGTLAARNLGQQLRTRFDGRGFTTRPDVGGWTWGLELKSYGFSGGEKKIGPNKALVSSDQGRVHYDWDASLREWFVNDPRGVEQGWTVKERPKREPAQSHPSSRLAFTFSTRGGLVPRVSADGNSVSFTDAAGAAVITYGGLKAWDANHQTLPVRFEIVAGDANSLRVTVEENGAHYPITVDPIAQQAQLLASNANLDDFFGHSVAVSGDTVVVGAPGEDSLATGVNGNQFSEGAFNAGAAYVFVRRGTNWSQQAYLKASNADSPYQIDGHDFGWSVAVSGDTVVVGAPHEDSNATGVNGDQRNRDAIHSGAAYVFVRNGTTWSQQAYLKASNTEQLDGFGTSVAVSGNIVVVGAPFEQSNANGVNGNQADNHANGAGAAYVFFRNGNVSWSQVAYLKASNTGVDASPFANDEFGSAVAVSVAGTGTITDPFRNTVVVGAPFEDSNATGVNGNQADNSASGSGAAYVFVQNGSGQFATWSQVAYLKASNTGAGDNFGGAVAVSRDTVVVGAFGEDSNATGVNGGGSDNSAAQSGAAYVFVRSGTTWSQQAYLKASNTDASDSFGRSVAVSGDTVVIGAPGESSNVIGVNAPVVGGSGTQADNSVGNSGAAYLFVRSGTTWRQEAYLKASNTGRSDSFGASVAVAGDIAVGGAPEPITINVEDKGLGAAYVFSGFAVTISINNVVASEPTLGGIRAVVFTVTLSSPSPGLTIPFRTRSGTATAGADYVSISGELPISQGALSATISVFIMGDLVNEKNETFFVDLLSVSGNATIADGVGQCTILDTPLFTGAFEMSLDNARVQVDEITHYSVTWTVPEGEAWRDLKTIDLRLRQGNKTALLVRWDEAANTFRVCETNGKHDSDVNCTPAQLPGSPFILETTNGRLYVAESSVVGSGPTGRSVTLNLAISLGPKAHGQYRVELAASDDFGKQDDFVRASDLHIERARRR